MRRRSFALLARPLAATWLGLVAACFDAPAATVMFTCDVASEPACPAGYTCQSDGCCHADGSDVAAHAGECMLGGATDVSASATATAGSSSSAGSSEGSTGSGSTGSGSTGSGSNGSSSTGSASESSSGADASSSGGADSGSSSGGSSSGGGSTGTAGSSGSTSI
ncbi:MAG: hypothetical protein IPK74_36615 [Deltaproteobacteria bacterium]|nr:hypothetical protein [Deltaproteobacteria bacterium]